MTGNGLLVWLHTQMTVMVSTLAAIASNRPAPARQVVIYVLALVVLAIGVPRLVKIFKK